MRRWRRGVQAAMLVAGAYYLLFGFWALLAPGSFYYQIAGFVPLNVHFLHDAGAFQIGLGLALVLVVVMSDALLAVALAVGTASLLHVVAHIVDINRGGQPLRDITALALLTAVLAAVVLARLSGRARGKQPSNRP